MRSCSLLLLSCAYASALLRAPALRTAQPRQLSSRIVATTALPNTAAVIAPEDEWTQKLDYSAFQKEVGALGDKLEREQGAADVAHLRKMCLWSNTCGGFGLLTMWSTNPVLRAASIFARVSRT